MSTQEPQLDQMSPPELRDFAKRQQQAAADALAQAGDTKALQRENVLLKAGVNLDSPIGKLFATGYGGELTPEAVTTAWAEVAPAAAIPPVVPAADATPAPPAEASADELEVAAARAALTQGTVGPAAEPVLPAGEAMIGAFNDARKNGRPMEAAQRAGLQELMNRAVDGDETALFQKPGEPPQVARQRWTEKFQ